MNETCHETGDHDDTDRDAGTNAGSSGSVRASTDRSRPVRERVTSVVRAGHDGDAEAVRAALDDDDATVRAAAVGASIRLAANGSASVGEAADALLRGLSDDEVAVRRRSATATAGWSRLIEATDSADESIRGIVDALILLLDDDDERVVEVAAFACGELPLQALDLLRQRVITSLMETTTHPDHLCRESAVAALGSIGEPSALPAVLAACRDRANVRRRAVLALAAFDDAAATTELRRLVEDRDLQVSQAAAELLAIESGEPT